jgi:hypothetical protein
MGRAFWLNLAKPKFVLVITLILFNPLEVPFYTACLVKNPEGVALKSGREYSDTWMALP